MTTDRRDGSTLIRVGRAIWSPHRSVAQKLGDILFGAAFGSFIGLFVFVAVADRRCLPLASSAPSNDPVSARLSPPRIPGASS